MASLLFLFLDGLGLGADDPAVNPLAAANLPTLDRLLEGRRLTAASAPYDGPLASLHALDATLGVSGLPQSATGQAVLLTGRNVPAELGYHYGPKPNPPVAEILRNGNLFARLRSQGKTGALLSAYPPGYFDAVASGKRNYSAIPLAAESAGVPLRTQADLLSGQALSADFTGQGWRDHLGLESTPLLTPAQAGRRLANLGLGHDFSFFEYWLSDVAGHKQDFAAAVGLLEQFDAVLDGLVEHWDFENGLILLTSDHGNLEDLSTRRHTANPAPLLLIGAQELRARFFAAREDAGATGSAKDGDSSAPPSRFGKGAGGLGFPTREDAGATGDSNFPVTTPSGDGDSALIPPAGFAALASGGAGEPGDSSPGGSSTLADVFPAIIDFLCLQRTSTSWRS